MKYALSLKTAAQIIKIAYGITAALITKLLSNNEARGSK
jgi:hypothetical protein